MNDIILKENKNQGIAETISRIARRGLPCNNAVE